MLVIRARKSSAQGVVAGYSAGHAAPVVRHFVPQRKAVAGTAAYLKSACAWCLVAWAATLPCLAQTIEVPARRSMSVSAGSGSAGSGSAGSGSAGESKTPTTRLPIPARLRSTGDEHASEPIDREVKPAGYASGEADLPLAPRRQHANQVPRPAASGASRMIATMISSLALVLGLFLLLVWLVRRSMPRSTATLPKEVVEVFGRTAITPRQSVHVIRFGSKMLLLSITPGGMESLAEITDPAEVDRLAGLCVESQPGSVSRTFRQLIAQIGSEPTNRGFVDESPEMQRTARTTGSRSAAGVRHA